MRPTQSRKLTVSGSAARRPVDTIALHRDHRSWLDTSLAEPFDGETVVVTHHAPHPDCLQAGHSLAAAYASDLSTLILRREPLIWAHGHVHQHSEVQLGRTRIINVALGYPRALDADSPKTIRWQG